MHQEDNRRCHVLSLVRSLVLVECSSRHFRSSVKHVASVISVQELRNSTRRYLPIRVSFSSSSISVVFPFVFSLLITSRCSRVWKTRLIECVLLFRYQKMNCPRKKRITDNSDELVRIVRVKYAGTSRTYHRL